MTRTLTLSLVLGALAVQCGCQNLPIRSTRSVAVGGGALDQAQLERQMARFPSAPRQIADTPLWVRIGEVSIEQTISESKRSMLPEHLESLSGWLRTEVRDQVVLSPHFRVAGEWGDGPEAPEPVFEIHASVRRLDKGPAQASSVDQRFQAGRAGTDTETTYVEVVHGTPISFQVRLRLIALETADPLVPDAFGLDGEIVAIGSGIQSLTIASSQQIRREGSISDETQDISSEFDQDAKTEVIEKDSVPVGVEQVPTIGMIGVRNALASMLDDANRHVFKPGLRIIKAAEDEAKKQQKEGERAEREG